MVERYRPLGRQSFGGSQGRRYEGHSSEDQPTRRPERAREELPQNDLSVRASDQMNGEIVTLANGCGWIRGDGDGIDRFFHKSALFGFGMKFDDLVTGQRVLFTHIDGPKGPRAINVRAQRGEP